MFDPATELQDFLVHGEFGDVNPSISDSSTFCFPNLDRMEEAFEHDIAGCFLYSRHLNPTGTHLSAALARMEGGEAAHVMGSGMAAISSVLLALCSAGDEIVSSRVVYGGTYALMANFLPRLGVTTRFVDLADEAAVRAAMGPRTRVVYCESLSNPLLGVADLPLLAGIAHEHGAQLVVDNTFSPLIISPLRHGADVVVHSLTKFINGTSDCVAGCAVGTHDFIAALTNPNHGPSMLLGPVLDAVRAASILKNLHGLHVRMAQHGRNALYLARRFEAAGVRVYYPGLDGHPGHGLMTRLMNSGFGYGGVVTVDVGDRTRADLLMQRMQRDGVGFLAVSLGYFRTLFSAPGHSTSSEIPESEREQLGMADGLIRFSVGLDNDIERTWQMIARLLAELGIAGDGSGESGPAQPVEPVLSGATR